MNLYFCTLIIKTGVGILCAHSELDVIENSQLNLMSFILTETPDL